MAGELHEGEYTAYVTKAAMLARLVDDIPVEKVIETMDYASSMGPFIDPTAYRNGIDRLRGHRDLLKAIGEVQKAYRGLAEYKQYAGAAE